MSNKKNKVTQKKKEKPNEKTTSTFIKILAGLLSVIIVCLAINVTVGKITAKISTGDSNSVSADNGGSVIADNGGAVADNGGSVVADFNGDANGGTVADNGGDTNQQTNNGGTTPNNGTTAAVSTDPTSFSKAQVVEYYNQCLRKAYSQPKFTVTKTEKVAVQLGEMLLNGKPATSLESMANKVVAKNTKNETKSQQFTSSTAKVDAQERYILPSRLTAAGVRNYSIQKNGAGYVVNFTLVAESCDFRTKPQHNSSCTFPLDFTEIDLGGLGEITSAQFYYPGTTLKAVIDGSGRVARTDVVMPLSVDNASGQGMGQTLSVDISGQWTCTTVNTF